MSTNFGRVGLGAGERFVVLNLRAAGRFLLGVEVAESVPSFAGTLGGVPVTWLGWMGGCVAGGLVKVGGDRIS